LHKAGFAVSVVNPKVTKHYAQAQMQRNKTDKLDARMLAAYCRKEEPRLWEPPSEAEMVLRALTRRLAALQKDRTREINRLKAGKHPQPVQTSMRQMIAFQETQIAKLKAEIQDHIDQNPELKQQQELLTSIPGIGDKTAAVILGELPDVKQFDTAKQVTAYAGLTPQQLQSGKTLRQGGLTKMGSKHLRTALFLPALYAKQKNPLLAPFAQRLEAAGKGKMTIVGAVMRKLLHLIYGVLKSQQPFDPHYLVNVQNAV
jgi:transposase